MIAGASVYNLRNVSDDSMFEPLYRALREGLEADEPITLLCRHPEDRRIGDDRLETVQNLDFPSKEASLGRRFHGFNTGDSVAHLHEAASRIRTARALIIGGDPFIEITLGAFRGLLPYVQMLVTLARFEGTPVILFGVHLGRPPESEHGREIARFILDNASLITTREDSVVPTLQEWTGNPAIVPGADAGFSTHATPEPGIAAVLPPYAVATIRSLYWTWRAPEREDFAARCAEVLDAEIAEQGMRVRMIPHCTYDNDHEWEDDRGMHRLIKAYSAHAEWYDLVETEPTVPEVIDAHTKASFVLSNRRHAGIFAALTQTPFVIFGERSHLAPIHDILSEGPFLDYEQFFRPKGTRLLRAAISTCRRHEERRAEIAREKALEQRQKSDKALRALVTFVREQD